MRAPLAASDSVALAPLFDALGGGTANSQIIANGASPADGATSGDGLFLTNYRVQISALQEAADDYSSEVRYIGTPTF